MNAHHSPTRERLDELLADEAAAALDSADARELASLLDRHPDVARDDLLQAAGLAQVGFQRRNSLHRMPAALKERLALEGAALVVRQSAPARQQTTTSRWSPVSGLGWALAAMLAVAFVLVRNESPLVAPAGNAAAARISLVDEAADVITLPWAPPTAAGYQGVTGDVVWSQARQQGYLRLAHMPVNDPARTQYQLWIVDPRRDAHPVDGGVFNVSSSGEVIIPIQARLPIQSPKAFAITAEQPGGVVVSAGPLLVIASI